MEKRLLSRDKIVGKQVIDSNGMMLGTIKDIAFDLAQSKMAVTIADEKGKETEVSSDDVSAVGDVVLLKRPREAEAVEVPRRPSPSTKPAPSPTAKAPTSPGLCPNCGYQNEPASRFCIKCGTGLK